MKELKDKDSIKTKWRGLPLDENGDIVGAIPSIFSTPGRIVPESNPTEFSTPGQIVEAIYDNTKSYIYQQFIKVDVDPEVVEKQLSEILMLKQKVEQLESQIADYKKELIEERDSYKQLLEEHHSDKYADSKGTMMFARIDSAYLSSYNLTEILLAKVENRDPLLFCYGGK